MRRWYAYACAAALAGCVAEAAPPVHVGPAAAAAAAADWSWSGQIMPLSSSATAMDSVGLMAGAVYTDAGSATLRDSTGYYFQQSGGATIHYGITPAGSGSPVGHIVIPAELPVFTAIFRIESTGGSPGMRLFYGLSADPLVGNITASNDPAFEYLGLQYAADRDTTWQIAARSSAQDLTDTGVAYAFDTTYKVEIAFTAADSATVRLWNAAGSPAYEGTITTELPAATSGLAFAACFVNDFAPAVAGHKVRNYGMSLRISRPAATNWTD